MFDNQVTREQYGLNNERGTSLFSDFPLPNQLRMMSYVQDFFTLAAADFTLTKVGTGTNALTAANGGALLMTTTAGATDSNSLELTAAAFKLQAGYRSWGRIIAQLDVATANLILGIGNSTATPVAGFTDGIWLSTAGTTAFTASIQANSGTAQTITPTPTLVVGSPFTFSWYYDGALYAGPQYGRVVFQLEGAGVSANWRGEIACGSTFPYTTLLTPQIEIQNAAASAHNLTIDLIAVYNERVSPGATPAF